MKVRLLILLTASASLSGCASVDHKVDAYPAACSNQLIGNSSGAEDQLDSGDIHLVNWNIQKGGDPDWSADLASLSPGDDPDLMVLQEVPFDQSLQQAVGAGTYQAFAPGYRTSRAVTGVMTVSSARPLTQCNLVALEPWIRSAKATVITEYGLTDTDNTLLVVNVHAVNFTFGIRDFEQQIRQSLGVLEQHSGPILLSGDFNTWHARRTEILQQMTDGLGLLPLSFSDDHRKRFFGQALDHIYVRGLEVVESSTREVDTSDHNPMAARLRVYTQ